MKFTYPIDIKSIDETKVKYLKGASNKTGYYPIGRMNTWHGGVHFEGDKPLYAIADGTVVAYRVPKAYFEETIDGEVSKYSNGFVLIQHQYESPKGQKMTFYSLYMHLSSYEEMKGEKIPDIFKSYEYSVKKTVKDYDTAKGAKIKDTNGNLLAVAAKGTKLNFIAEDEGEARRKVEYTTPKGEKIEGTTYSIEYKNQLLVDQDTGEVLTDMFEGSNGDYGAKLLNEAKSSAKVLRIIPRETKVEIAAEDQGKKGWLKVTKVGDEEVTGYCNSSSLDQKPFNLLSESETDKVCSVCIEVKAGTIIGFTGLNGFEKSAQYRGGHVEVFATDEKEVTNFISNTKGDGDENKHFAKLSAETALKIAIPISLPANMPVKSTGCSNYVSIMEQVEVAELELVISDRNTQLPKYYKSGFYTFESTEEDQSRLTEFNKLIGGCAQIGDKVKLVEEFDGTDYRRVIYMPSQKGLRFWVEKVKLEDKILTYNLPEEEQVGPLRLPDEYDEYDEYIGGSVFGTSRYFQFIEDGNAIEEKPTEEKTYLILNTPLSEVNILNPIDYQDVSIESDIIVDTKTATHYHDDEEKEWLLIDHKDIGANGAPVNYKGLIKEEELTDRFSAYDWAKFGFEIKDAGAEYIYNFDEKSDFFNEICELVDQDENGILEPYELQRALNSHYTAHKLSQLVCKHHSEWAYGGQYLSSLMNQVTGVFDEGIKLESDDTRKQALEELKTERLDAFEAKVCQLYYWQDINIPALESKPINFVEGAFTTQQTTGKYLKFEDSSWVSKTDSSNESPVDLVAFPIDNPVVYHFHPVAFVEQMRRINGGFYYEIYHTGEIICNGDIEKAKEVSFIYYDKNGGKHELGTYKLVEVPDFESGKTKKPTANLNNYEVRSGTYNRKKKTIWYKKKNKKFKAVNIKENFTGSHYVYTKDDFVLKFKSISNRPYARPECFAALLGAIADTGYEDIKINGFTSKDGTSFPSVSHPGGINVDISNLDNADFKTADGGIKIANSNYSRERTRTLANSMIKFRYYRIRTSDVELCKYGANASKWDCTNKEKPCRYITGHEDHLHCEGFNNK